MTQMIGAVVFPPTAPGVEGSITTIGKTFHYGHKHLSVPGCFPLCRHLRFSRWMSIAGHRPPE